MPNLMKSRESVKDRTISDIRTKLDKKNLPMTGGHETQVLDRNQRKREFRVDFAKNNFMWTIGRQTSGGFCWGG